jgi:PAS domain S-box-containing protein
MPLRVRDYHELAVTASRFAAVFSALSDGVIATGEGGQIIEANPAAHRIFGRTQLTGAALGDVLPPGRTEVVDRRGDRTVRRWRMPAEDREVVLEVVTTPTLDESGAPVGAVHTIRDITEQAELLRLKEEFLLDIAHELRTPIAALTASLDLLYQDATSMKKEELRSMVATLRRSALRLGALVENVLDVGSIQAGTFQVRAVMTSLRRCIDDAFYLTRPLFDSKQQKVDVRIPRGCDHILADPRRTTQVAANLFSNAFKYAPDSTRIEVAAEPIGGFVRVSVRDQGPGIREEERARIFDRFYRSRITRSEAGGIGLGLAICRAIVEAQGGEIGVDTAPQGGTIVHFTVPRARAAQGGPIE